MFSLGSSDAFPGGPFTRSSGSSPSYSPFRYDSAGRYHISQGRCSMTGGWETDQLHRSAISSITRDEPSGLPDPLDVLQGPLKSDFVYFLFFWFSYPSLAIQTEPQLRRHFRSVLSCRQEADRHGTCNSNQFSDNGIGAESARPATTPASDLQSPTDVVRSAPELRHQNRGALSKTIQHLHTVVHSPVPYCQSHDTSTGRFQHLLPVESDSA